MALQALFVRLTEKGFEQTVMSNMEPLLKLAMRAQGQCRATVKTLAQIKYLQALVITRQTNIAHGHQQVNNGVSHEASGIEQNQVKGEQMANVWTPERRKRQSVLIQSWRPWQQSTGPKTPEGKRAGAMRAYKGGVRELIRQARACLREIAEQENRVK
jgi:hypothetical protein